MRAITVRGGVVEITIQHEAQPSGVLFIETHFRVPLSRAHSTGVRTMSYLLCAWAHQKHRPLDPLAKLYIAMYQDG